MHLNTLTPVLGIANLKYLLSTNMIGDNIIKTFVQCVSSAQHTGHTGHIMPP